MAHYPTSTQKRKWIFSDTQLNALHDTNNSRAVEAVRENLRRSTACTPNDILRCDPPTVEEEASIRKFYERQLLALCNSFKFPHKVHGAALIFFKRFYTRKSVVEFPPKAVMLTCVYIACKSEEAYVSSEQLARGAQQNVAQIVSHEVPVLQHLDFELVVFAPYRPLVGLLLQINRSADPPLDPPMDLDQDAGRECLAAARVLIDSLMLTDAPLLFPPGQIALCALRSACRRRKLSQVEAEIDRLVEQNKDQGNLGAALDVLDKMCMQGSAPINEEEVRSVDLKLRQWKLSDDPKEQKRKGKTRRAGETPGHAMPGVTPGRGALSYTPSGVLGHDSADLHFSSAVGDTPTAVSGASPMRRDSDCSLTTVPMSSVKRRKASEAGNYVCDDQDASPQ